jgi:hypothetical protein
MNHSISKSYNYVISMLSKMVVSSLTSDSSEVKIGEPINKKEMIQNWINNSKTKMENKNSNKEFLNHLQNKVNNYNLPSLELINVMSLEEIITYEAMLVDIVDIIPSNLNLTVKILMHLKIITNHQIHKFNIFA